MAEATITICDREGCGVGRALPAGGRLTLTGETSDHIWDICLVHATGVVGYMAGAMELSTESQADSVPRSVAVDLVTALRVAMARNRHRETDCDFGNQGASCPMCDPLRAGRAAAGIPAPDLQHTTDVDLGGRR